MSENASGGIPSTGVPVPPQPAPGERPNLFKQFIEDIKAFRTLRRTPYGFGPASIIVLVGFFHRLDAQAFSVASPYIVRELEIEIPTIIQIQQFIGVASLILVIFGGWYFDRHQRAPRSEEHTSELQSRLHLVCRLLLE